jgi:hypothetical protein
MPTLRFEGYSDDTFGEYAHANDDYDNCASRKPIQYAVVDPKTGLGVVVTGQYCYGRSTSWMIGVANYHPDDGKEFPDWPMELTKMYGRFADSPVLKIEAPEGVDVRCLERE